VDDKEPDHDDGRPTSSLVGRPLVFVLGENNGNDEVAKAHPEGTERQCRSSSDSVNVQDRWNSSQQHHDADDTGGQKRHRVRGQTESIEDLWRIVQNGVDAGPLLEEHGHRGHNHSAEHGHRLEKRADSNKLELDGVPCREFGQVGEVGRNCALLKERLRLDLQEFELDQLRFNGQRSQGGQSATGLLFSAVMEQPTGRERHPDHADQQDHRREQLKGKRNEPGRIGLGFPSASDVVGAVILCTS
jgi:hypothetical protein